MFEEHVMWTRHAEASRYFLRCSLYREAVDLDRRPAHPRGRQSEYAASWNALV